METSEKAIYLINRFISGDISDTESAELDRLISGGEVTTEELADFQRIWNATRSIDLTFSDPGTALKTFLIVKPPQSRGHYSSWCIYWNCSKQVFSY